MVLKFIPWQLFVVFCLFCYKRFLFYMFVNKNERLSGCGTSEEMLCLCVGFKKFNLRCLKFNNIIQVAFQIIVCFVELERIFNWYCLNVFDFSPVFHKISENRNLNIYKIMIITFTITLMIIFIHNCLCIYIVVNLLPNLGR